MKVSEIRNSLQKNGFRMHYEINSQKVFFCEITILHGITLNLLTNAMTIRTPFLSLPYWSRSLCHLCYAKYEKVFLLPLHCKRWLDFDRIFWMQFLNQVFTWTRFRTRRNENRIIFLAFFYWHRFYCFVFSMTKLLLHTVNLLRVDHFLPFFKLFKILQTNSLNQINFTSKLHFMVSTIMNLFRLNKLNIRNIRKLPNMTWFHIWK